MLIEVLLHIAAAQRFLHTLRVSDVSYPPHRNLYSWCRVWLQLRLARLLACRAQAAAAVDSLLWPSYAPSSTLLDPLSSKHASLSSANSCMMKFLVAKIAFISPMQALTQADSLRALACCSVRYVCAAAPVPTMCTCKACSSVMCAAWPLTQDACVTQAITGLQLRDKARQSCWQRKTRHSKQYVRLSAL